jgi:ribosomal protein L37AE/L43A
MTVVEPRRCSDCGTSLGELNRDHTGDWLCFSCFQKRPDPDPVAA